MNTPDGVSVRAWHALEFLGFFYVPGVLTMDGSRLLCNRNTRDVIHYHQDKQPRYRVTLRCFEGECRIIECTTDDGLITALRDVFVVV